jgi:hypothetical protein
MKAIKVFIAMVCLLAMVSVRAQVVNVPGNAKEHFLKTYKNAKDETWSNNVTNYTVKFNDGGKVCRGHYDVDGSWSFTETLMDLGQMPKSVQESLSKSRFADWKTLGVTEIHNSKKQHLYRVEVSKGIQKQFIFYDENGKEVKSSIKV